jgi:hypothetical protein
MKDNETTLAGGSKSGHLSIIVVSFVLKKSSFEDDHFPSSFETTPSRMNEGGQKKSRHPWSRE